MTSPYKIKKNTKNIEKKNTKKYKIIRSYTRKDHYLSVGVDVGLNTNYK